MLHKYSSATEDGRVDLTELLLVEGCPDKAIAADRVVLTKLVQGRVDMTGRLLFAGLNGMDNT